MSISRRRGRLWSWFWCHLKEHKETFKTTPKKAPETSTAPRNGCVFLISENAFLCAIQHAQDRLSPTRSRTPTDPVSFAYLWRHVSTKKATSCRKIWFSECRVIMFLLAMEFCFGGGSIMVDLFLFGGEGVDNLEKSILQGVDFASYYFRGAHISQDTPSQQ